MKNLTHTFQNFLIGLLICGFYQLNAQSLTPEVLTTAGETFTGTNVSLAWTLGEIMTETYSGTIVLTQGFHQPSLKATSVEKAITNFGTIKVYPNPTVGSIYVEREKGQQLEVRLMDIKGSLILKQSIQPLKGELDLTPFANGIYLLQMSDVNHFTYTVRIKKQ